MQRQMTEIDNPDGVRERPKSPRFSVFEGYITEIEYARQRGVSVRTCQRDRALRHAPPHVILGNRVFYRVDSIRTWLKDRERSVERALYPRPASGR